MTPISPRRASSQHIISAWLAGATMAAVARRFGITRDAVRKLVHRHTPESVRAKRIRVQKPAHKKGEAKTKLIRYEPVDLALIERAAKSLTPAPSSSYYIVQASLAQARRDLGIPA